MSWRVRITLIVILFPVTQISLGNFSGRVGNTAALHLEHHAALPRSMPSLQMCSTARTSPALIFDSSYGALSCVSWSEENASRSPHPSNCLASKPAETLAWSEWSAFSLFFYVSGVKFRGRPADPPVNEPARDCLGWQVHDHNDPELLYRAFDLSSHMEHFV